MFYYSSCARDTFVPPSGGYFCRFNVDCFLLNFCRWPLGAIFGVTMTCLSGLIHFQLLGSVANGWYPSGGLLRLLSMCLMGVLGSMFLE